MSTSGYATNQNMIRFTSEIDGANSFERNIVTRGSDATRSLYEKT